MIDLVAFEEVEHDRFLVLQLMARFYVEGFSAAPWKESWSVESALTELRLSLQQGKCLLVMIDSQLAGFGIGCPLKDYSSKGSLESMGVTKNSFYVKELITAAEFRQRGVCTQICSGFEKMAKEAGFYQIVLRTRVDNRALFGVCDRIKMNKLGSYQAETGGVNSERVVYVKSL